MRGLPGLHESNLLELSGYRGWPGSCRSFVQNRLHSPDIVILLETKNRSNRYVYLKRRLGMDFMHAVEPRGIAGGMCIFWRNYDQVMLVKFANFFIEVGICDGLKHEQWRLFVIYASTDDKKRKEQWRQLAQRIALAVDNVCLLGTLMILLMILRKKRGTIDLLLVEGISVSLLRVID